MLWHVFIMVIICVKFSHKVWKFHTWEVVPVFPNHANFREMGTLYFEVESIKIKKRFFLWFSIKLYYICKRLSGGLWKSLISLVKSSLVFVLVGGYRLVAPKFLIVPTRAVFYGWMFRIGPYSESDIRFTHLLSTYNLAAWLTHLRDCRWW